MTADPPAAAIPAAELPAELASAAAEAMPGATVPWLRALLRDCGEYGLALALLVVAWVKVRKPRKPARYAYTALAGWLNKLRAGLLTMDDVRTEVYGKFGPRASPFDPSAMLARLRAVGWIIRPDGSGGVERVPLGTHAPDWGSDAVTREAEAHKAELKAYVLKQATGREVARE